MPTPWYILNGEKTFGMGIFQIDEGIDTGPVFVQRQYPIAADETGHGLLRKTMKAGADLYMENFDRIVRGELIAQPQQGTPLFCPRIEPQYRIEWTSPREMISRRIRVHAKPYFPAYTFAYSRMVAINRARLDDSHRAPSAAPGKIVESWDDGRFTVACGDGILVVEDYDVCPPLDKQAWRLHFEPGTQLS